MFVTNLFDLSRSPFRICSYSHKKRSTLGAVFLYSSTIVTFFTSCGKKDAAAPGDSSSASASGYSNIFVSTKSKGAVYSLTSSSPTSCSIGFGPSTGQNAQGVCLTPTAVSAWLAGISLSRLDPSSATAGAASSARVLGGGSGWAKYGYLDGGVFEFNKPSLLQGEDNLWGVYATKPQFNLVLSSLAWLRFAFEHGADTWDVLVPFYDQPVEAGAWAKTCFDAAYLEQLSQKGNVLTGLTFHSGDYLFCKRNSAGTPCSLDAFRWFDLDANALVATRPANPKQSSYAANKIKPACVKAGSADGSGAPPETANKFFPFMASINTPLKLYGDFSHGSNSGTNKGGQRPADVTEDAWKAHTAAGKPKDPYFLYFLESSDGQTTKGNKLNIDFTFDFSNLIFFPGVQNLSTATEIEVLKAVTTKDIWMRDALPDGGEYKPEIKADVTAAVSTVPLEQLYATPTPGATPQPQTSALNTP